MNHTKKCCTCQEIKDLTLFHKSANLEDGLSKCCKVCANACTAKYRSKNIERNRKWFREYYLKNPELHKTKRNQKRQELREWFILQKEKPCMDCGMEFPACCMDFDHKPEFEKKGNVANMVNQMRKFDIIIAEIAKCELVCANCHRIRTHKRNEQTYNLK